MIDIEELSNRLSIKIDFQEAGRAYYDGNHTLKVTLLLDDVEISSSETSLPNNDRENAY